LIRKPISWNVKQVCRMIEKGSITFDNPIQRPSGQWKLEDASLLIHSLLTMFVPDVYAIQHKGEIDGKEANIYDIIDGKQRLTLINSFRNNEWSLTKLYPVKLETGEEYDISGLTFEQLPEEVQDAIDSYTITFRVIELEDGDDEESIVEDIFYRLNNGKAVSREHLALVSAQKHVREFVYDIVNNHHVFKVSAHFPASSVRKSDMEMSVLQSIILAGGYEYNSFAAKDIEKTISSNDIEDEVLQKVRAAFDALANVFTEKHKKFVVKINIPPMIALLTNNDHDKAGEFLRYYADNIKKGDEYKRYTGAGNTKKHMVQGRVDGLQKLFDEWLNTQQ